MADLEKHPRHFEPKRLSGCIKQNPHMAVSIGLFVSGGAALALNIAPLAGSLLAGVAPY